MTTQDAGRQAGGDKGGDKGSIDPDEAERLASMIRPAWELDLVEGELSAPTANEPAAPAEPAAPVITEATAPAVAIPRPQPPQVTPPLGTPQMGTPQMGAPADRASADRLTNRLTDGGVDPSIAPGTTASLLPRDTVIDGAPMVNVGDRASQDTAASEGTARTSVAAAIAQGIEIVDRGAKVAPAHDARPLPAPVRAGPTKLGLGEGVADIVAQANAEADDLATTLAQGTEGKQIVARGVPTAAMTDVVLAPPAGAPRKGGTIRMADANAIAELNAVSPPAARQSSAPPAPLEPVAPQGASFSRAEDPIELPVQKSSSIMFVVIGLVVLVGAVVGGVMLLGGSDTPEKKTTSETRSTEDAPKTTATTTSAATAKPTETSAPTSTSAATSASATATASASASASAAPSAKPTTEPVATTEPTATAKPPRTAPPKTTGTPPKTGPKPTSTGIIRDTPF